MVWIICFAVSVDIAVN